MAGRLGDKNQWFLTWKLPGVDFETPRPKAHHF